MDAHTSTRDVRSTGAGQQWLAVRVIGAGLLIATGAIHLDLYLTGYRSIPAIGWLFLAQVVTAFLLGVFVLVSGSRLMSAAGAGFAIATLGGYLLSLRVGLFGFREVRTSAGIVAGVIEIVTFAVLAAVVLRVDAVPGDRAGRFDSRIEGLLAAVPAGHWAAGAFSALAAVLLGLSVAATGPGSTNSGTSRALVKVTKIHGTSVLTNARGFTLYWFVPDTPTKSSCYGTCAVYWPPVTGTPTAGPGVTGRMGTIARSGGALQVTYNGHPLYTYVGDSAPGQASGNAINLNGGVWYEMTAG